MTYVVHSSYRNVIIEKLPSLLFQNRESPKFITSVFKISQNLEEFTVRNVCRNNAFNSYLKIYCTFFSVLFLIIHKIETKCSHTHETKIKHLFPIAPISKSRTNQVYQKRSLVIGRNTDNIFISIDQFFKIFSEQLSGLYLYFSGNVSFILLLAVVSW